MKNLSKMKFRTSLLVALLVITSSAMAQVGAWNPKLEEKSQRTISAFKERNDKMESYFKESFGYVAFPSIGKGGIVVGGAHGRGIVYEQGEIIGEAKMTQVTLGLQWGGQAFSEIIFFKDAEALESFKNSDLEFAGQASVVAITKGASVDIAYENGVAVYTISKAGLMYEASIGGQKFNYLPNDVPEEEEQIKAKTE
jgi:lipid-binding SYLF domain-containing protein